MNLTRLAVRDVDGVRQSAEPLVAHVIKQLVLHLLVRKVVQALQNQDSNHRLRRVGGRPPAGSLDVAQTRLISAASAAKSMCDSILASGS